MNTPGTATAENGGDFDPWQAAAMLDQATAQARRTFTPLTPLLWALQAVVVLVVFCGFWLSVRGQSPYSGPAGAALPVAFALVAVNIVWSAWAIRRASAGVTSPVQRKRRAWMGRFGGPAGAWLIMGTGLCAVCLGTAAFTAWALRRSVVRL
jgi:hypothetical protein